MDTLQSQLVRFALGFRPQVVPELVPERVRHGPFEHLHLLHDLRLPALPDLLQRGVRVNVVSPGPIETPIFGRVGLSEEQLRQTKEWITSQVPLKHFGHPDDIAKAVLYLSSPASAFVVGTELVVDGGMIQL